MVQGLFPRKGTSMADPSLDELRQKAEAALAANSSEVPSTPKDYWKIVHDLQTHQIELEMQNEELRRTQEDLFESRDRYAELYDFAPVGYMTVSDKGLIAQTNLTMARMLGVERSFLINQPISGCILPEDQDIYYQHRRKLLGFGEQQTCELRLCNKNGIPFWVRMGSTLTGAPDPVHRIRIAVTDISAMKQAERELQLHRDCLEELVHHRTIQLTEANQQLHGLLEMYEHDRTLAAHEIHDGFIQPLIAAKMRLESHLRSIEQLCCGADRNECQLTLHLLDDSLREARNLMGRQRPAVLDEFGLVAAIDQLVLENRKHTEMDIHYLHDVQFDRLAPPLETAIFRIVQEALSNARRHSKSKTVSIKLTQEYGSVQVVVVDHGIGFDSENVGTDHFGLAGLRERARLFGGKSTVDSSASEGTRITAVLPIAASTVSDSSR
jgi:PAS domain S-box-containing protein